MLANMLLILCCNALRNACAARSFVYLLSKKSTVLIEAYFLVRVSCLPWMSPGLPSVCAYPSLLLSNASSSTFAWQTVICSFIWIRMTVICTHHNVCSNLQTVVYLSGCRTDCGIVLMPCKMISPKSRSEDKMAGGRCAELLWCSQEE